LQISATIGRLLYTLQAYTDDVTQAGSHELAHGRLAEAEAAIARACSSAVRLTANEWKHARKFGGQYWLYIVTDAGTDAPQLHRIQNPTACFVMDEDIVATGYEIRGDTWRGRLP